jgi:hypothetical protein
MTLDLESKAYSQVALRLCQFVSWQQSFVQGRGIIAYYQSHTYSVTVTVTVSVSVSVSVSSCLCLCLSLSHNALLGSLVQ